MKTRNLIFGLSLALGCATAHAADLPDADKGIRDGDQCRENQRNAMSPLLLSWWEKEISQ